MSEGRVSLRRRWLHCHLMDAETKTWTFQCPPRATGFISRKVMSSPKQKCLLALQRTCRRELQRVCSARRSAGPPAEHSRDPSSRRPWPRAGESSSQPRPEARAHTPGKLGVGDAPGDATCATYGWRCSANDSDGHSGPQAPGSVTEERGFTRRDGDMILGPWRVSL